MSKKKKPDLNATEPMEYIPLDEMPELIEKRKAFKIPSYQERFHESIDLPEELMKEKMLGKYNVPIKMDMDKNIHLPESDVSKYISKQQAKGRLFKKLTDVLSSPAAKGLGKAVKYGAPLLAVASDVLASEEAGDVSSEEQELERAKKEFLEKKKEERMSPEQKMMRQRMQEISSERLTPEEIVKPKTEEELKAPIKRHMFEALTGTKMPEPEMDIAKDKRPRSRRYMKLMEHMYGKK